MSCTWLILVVAGMGRIAGERASSQASVTCGMVARAATTVNRVLGVRAGDPTGLKGYVTR